MEKLAKPHPHSGSLLPKGQAGSHGCKRHRAPWLRSLCQVLAQARQCEPLVLKDSGPSAQQPEWAPERDRDTGSQGAEDTAVRSLSPGLGSPHPGSCQKLGMDGVLEAGLALGPDVAAPADGGLCTPEPSLHPGKQMCQILERAADRKVVSSLLCKESS